MVTPRRVWIGSGIVVLAIAATVAILILTLDHEHTAANPRQPISGETSLSKSAALFADPVQARIEILVDRDRVDPAKVGFNPTWILYQRIGIPRVQRHDTGRTTQLVYTADLVCLTYSCLPSFTGTRVQFPQAKVFYTLRSDGRRRTLELPWSAFALGPRTQLSDLNNADPFVQPAWRATTEPQAVSYATSPSVLRSGLFVAAAVLFLLALGAFFLFARALKRRWRPKPKTPLEQAVVLVEKASAREDQQAKRKALELLSRELAHTGEGELALTARELAWAEATPVPSSTQPLTLDVRRVIAERSNGHAR